MNSPLDKSYWDDCQTLGKIEGHLMATFITIHRMVIEDDSKNEIEYIKTNLLDLERTPTITVKQEEQDSEHLLIDLLDSSGNKISADELDDLEKEGRRKKGKGRKSYWGCRRTRTILNLESCRLLTMHPPRNSPSWTIKQKDQHFEIQNSEELD
jgi:hypothetical protein